MDLSKTKKNEKPLTKSSAIKKVFKVVAVTTIFTSLAVISIYENYEPDFELTDDNTTLGSNLTSQEYGSLSVPTLGKCVILQQWQCSLQCGHIFLKRDEWMVYNMLIIAAKLEFPDNCKFKLDFVDFPNQSIEKNWLVINPDASPKILELLITNSDLAYVGPNSFSCFPDLQILCLVNTQIVHLSSAAFSNLPNLISLNLRQNYYLSSVENGLISNLPKLQELVIQDVMYSDADCTYKIGQFFKNVTGNFTANRIILLDFTQNCLVNVSKDFFKPYPNLPQIILRSNGLKNFEEGSLNDIDTKMWLFLENNKIERLPENVFGDFLRESGGSIFVNGNPLQCDCEMKWLQDLAKSVLSRYGYDDYNVSKSFKYGDLDDATCGTPEGVLFLEAEMCPDGEGEGAGTGSTAATTNLSTTTTEGTPVTSEDPSRTSAATSTTEETTNATTILPSLNVTNITTGSDQSTITSTYPPDAPDDGDDQIVEVKCHAQNKIAASRIIRSVPSYSSFKLQIGNVTDQGEFVFTLAPKTQRFQITNSEQNSLTVTFDDKEAHSSIRKNILWITYTDFPKITKSDTISSNCSTVTPKSPYIIQNLEPERSYLICVSDDKNANVNLLDCVPYTTKPLSENQAWLTFGSKPMAILLVVGAAVGAFLIGSGILYYMVRQNPTLIEGSKSVIVVKRQEKKQVMIMPKDYDTSTIKKFPRKLSDAYSVVSYISAIQPSQEELLSYRLERLKAMRAGEEKEKLTVPNSNSTPRSSVKTAFSDYTIYENDFELSQNYEQEFH